jgi:hypothetical protein
MRHRVLWILTILMVLMASELRPAPGEPLGSPVLKQLRNQHRHPQKAKRAAAFPQRPASESKKLFPSLVNQKQAGGDGAQKAAKGWTPAVPKISRPEDLSRARVTGQ